MQPLSLTFNGQVIVKKNGWPKIVEVSYNVDGHLVRFEATIQESDPLAQVSEKAFLRFKDRHEETTTLYEGNGRELLIEGILFVLETKLRILLELPPLK